MAMVDSLSAGAIVAIMLVGRGAASLFGSEGVGKSDEAGGNAALGRVGLDVERWVYIIGGVARSGRHGRYRWHGRCGWHGRHGRHRLAATGGPGEVKFAGVVGGASRWP